MPAGTNSQEYLNAFEFALKKLREFMPEFIFISAGFDGHIADPLAQLKLQTEDYYIITKRILKHQKNFVMAKLYLFWKVDMIYKHLQDSSKKTC